MQPPEEPDRRHRRWVLAQSVLWTPLLGFSAVWGVRGLLAPWMVAAAAALALLSFGPLWRLCGSGGRPADWVTFGRFALLIGVSIGSAASGELGLLLWGWACAAVLLDLADGYFARRFGGSPGGALLDMECDQFAVLLLSLIGAVVVDAGVWLLALPAMKTGSTLLLAGGAAKLGDPKPVEGDNRRGRYVCAAVMALLLTALAPFELGPLRAGAGLLAVALLAWSFGSDLKHQLPLGRRPSVSL